VPDGLGRSRPPLFIDTRRGGVHVWGDLKSLSSSRIRGAEWVITIESTLWGTEEHGAGRGGCPGSRPWPCGDHADVLAAPTGGTVVPVEGTVPCTWRGGVPRVLQRGKYEGSTRSWQHSGWSSAAHVRTVYRRFPQWSHSARDDCAVTGVGGEDPGHRHCAEWWPDAVWPGHRSGVVGI